MQTEIVSFRYFEHGVSEVILASNRRDQPNETPHRTEQVIIRTLDSLQDIQELALSDRQHLRLLHIGFQNIQTAIVNSILKDDETPVSAGVIDPLPQILERLENPLRCRV